MDTYKIVRMYQNGNKRTIETGLSLEEAQEHCKNPETSSSTCSQWRNRMRTKKYGPWFDGYTLEN